MVMKQKKWVVRGELEGWLYFENIKGTNLRGSQVSICETSILNMGCKILDSQEEVDHNYNGDFPEGKN